MSDSDPNFDVALTQAYQKRKAQTKAPAAIKPSIMAKARREEKGRSGVSVSGWFWQLGAAASVILFFVIYLMPDVGQMPQEVEQVTWLEVKSADKVESRKTSTRDEYRQLEQLYADRHKLIASARQLARLTYSDNDIWKFETCDDGEIILSGELLAMLQKYDLMAPVIHPGSPVLIGFDSDGHITGIDESDETLACD